MSVPTHIFIDTSIFDHCAYNFESASLRPIIDIAKKNKIILLLPYNIEKEMRRHITRRAEECVEIIKMAKKDVEKKAPFLIKDKKWKSIANNFPNHSFSFERTAIDELEKFILLFEVKKFDPSEIDFKTIIDWYEKGLAPFGQGKKKSEFPDAFAVQTLLNFSNTTGETIAVISEDPDFKGACRLYGSLLSYNSAGKYAESFLASDSRVEKLREIFLNNLKMIIEGIQGTFENLGFYSNNYDCSELEDINIDEVEFIEFNIIGIGENEVSYAFEAEVYFNILCTIQYDDDGYECQTQRRISDIAPITGIIKLKINEQWTGFDDIENLSIDETDIEIDVPDEDCYNDYYE